MLSRLIVRKWYGICGYAGVESRNIAIKVFMWTIFESLGWFSDFCSHIFTLFLNNVQSFLVFAFWRSGRVVTYTARLVAQSPYISLYFELGGPALCHCKFKKSLASLCLHAWSSRTYWVEILPTVRRST